MQYRVSGMATSRDQDDPALGGQEHALATQAPPQGAARFQVSGGRKAVAKS